LPLAAFAGRLIPVAVRRAPEPLHSTGTAAFQEEESGTAVYGIEGREGLWLAACNVNFKFPEEDFWWNCIDFRLKSKS